MSPITKLIVDELGADGTSQAIDILYSRLSGNNNQKKKRLAENAVLYGEISNGFLPAFLLATGINKGLLEQAINATRSKQIRSAWRKQFVSLGPHFRVNTKGLISSALFAGMLHRKLRIKPVPEDWRYLDEVELLRLAKEMAVTLALETPSTLPVFGAVSGFTFHLNSDIAHDFDRQGCWLKRYQYIAVSDSGLSCEVKSVSEFLLGTQK